MVCINYRLRHRVLRELMLAGPAPETTCTQQLLAKPLTESRNTPLNLIQLKQGNCGATNHASLPRHWQCPATCVLYICEACIAEINFQVLWIHLQVFYILWHAATSVTLDTPTLRLQARNQNLCLHMECHCLDSATQMSVYHWDGATSSPCIQSRFLSTDNV